MSTQEYHIGDLAKIISPLHTPGSSKERKKLAALFSKHEKPLPDAEVHPELTQSKIIHDGKKKKKSFQLTSTESSLPVPGVKRKKQKTVPITVDDEDDEIQQLVQKHAPSGKKKKKKPQAKVNDSLSNTQHFNSIPNKDESDQEKVVKKMKTALPQHDLPPGFRPPPGIVHESLTKPRPNRKRKRKDDADSDNDLGKDAEVSGRERQRKRRKEKSKKKRTVFVGNLPITVDKKYLKKLFKAFGKIETVRFRCAPPADPKIPKKVVAIKKEFHPERKNIVAFVCFTEEESAQKALSCNGRKVENLHIRVDLASNDKEHDNKRSIFVGNLPFDVEEDTVHDHFEACGEVENVRIIRDSKSGLGKGFGYILFKTKDSVSLALKLNKSELKGREIRVSHCTEQQKSKGDDKSLQSSPRKKFKVSGPGGNFKVDMKAGKHNKPDSSEHHKKKPFKPSNAPSGSFQGLQASQKLKKQQKKIKKKRAAGQKNKEANSGKTKLQKGNFKGSRKSKVTVKQKMKGSKFKRKT